MVRRLIFVGLLLIPGWSAAVGPQIVPNSPNCTLDWVAPKNPNGTPVSDLAGYRVYLARTPGAYDFTKPVASPAKPDLKSLCTTLGTLAVGQWYLVMRSYDTAGNVSINSAEVPFEVVLPDTTPPPPPTNVTIKDAP